MCLSMYLFSFPNIHLRYKENLNGTNIVTIDTLNTKKTIEGEETSHITSFSTEVRTGHTTALVHASQDTLESYLSEDALQVLKRRTSTKNEYDKKIVPEIQLLRSLSIIGFELTQLPKPVKI